MRTSAPRGRSVASYVIVVRSEEHTSELQSQSNLVCRLLLEKKIKILISEENTHPRLADTSHPTIMPRRVESTLSSRRLMCLRPLTVAVDVTRYPSLRTLPCV